MKEIYLDEKYILNHAYKFRSDITRIILTNNDSLFFDSNDPDSENVALTGFVWKTHPLIAYIFSFFDGNLSLNKCLTKLSLKTNISKDELLNAITPFIENEESMVFPMENSDRVFALPKRFLIKKEEYHQFRNILEHLNLNDFPNKLVDSSHRLNIPNNLCFMVNANCVTECIYCYADKTKASNHSISFERIKELVKEARILNIHDFNISGGEFFLYEHWEDLVKLLLENNYKPYISTKIPIGEKEINILMKLGINLIQISLDTININSAIKMLNVNEFYLNEMHVTLKKLEVAGIMFNVKSVITNHNDDLDSVRKLVEYLFSFSNCNRISIAPGEFSFYNSFNYRTTPEKFIKIKEYVELFKIANPQYNINVQDFALAPDPTISIDEKFKNFNARGGCSGNVSQFYILPDGKVTICEQMYWHPKFILGDLTSQSIMEMWNSQEALGLFNMKQQDFNKESACYVCDQFEECRRGLGACWRDAMFAYGKDNYDFPSPNCPYAPQPYNDIYL